MPQSAVKPSSAKRKLVMEEKGDSSPQGNSSHGKRRRVNDNELQASLKRKKRSSVQKFEVFDLEKDKAIGTSQPAVDDAKLRKVSRSKRFERRLPSKSPSKSPRKWSSNQEMCLLNAILDTRKPDGEVNMAAFYQRAREQIRPEVSTSQLYEKMRRMKKKFRSMVKERKQGKLAIRTAHEQTMFLLWEKLWGNIEARKPTESKKPNPEEKETEPNPDEKETESSRPNENEAENSNPPKADISNSNSAENSSSPREDTPNPNSAENSSSPREDTLNPSSAKRKLQMEEKGDLSPQGNSSHGKRRRVIDDELQASSKRKKRSSVQNFEGRSLSKSPVSAEKWSNDEEMCLVNAILDARTPDGKVNTAAFYQRAREQFRLEVSNSQLYEKRNRMKRKFWSMVKKRKEGMLAIKTAHEQTMFLLWEKLWGNIEAEKPMESEKCSLEEKETEPNTEDSCPNEIEDENSNPPKADISNPNTAEKPMEFEKLNPEEKETEPNPEEKETEPNPEKKDTEISSPNEIEAENSNPPKADISNPNSAEKPMESEKLNPEEKETESSSPNEIETEHSDPPIVDISNAISAENSSSPTEDTLNPNSAENSSSPREDTLNPKSAKNLKNRENRAINTSFAEGSEFRENSPINPFYAVNLDSEVNPSFAASPKHMENNSERALREEIPGDNKNPNFTASPKHMENKAKGSAREEIHGENTHLLEESIHQEIHMENAGVNSFFVEKSPRQEIHVGNARENGHAVDGSGLTQTQFRVLESRIEAMIESSIKGIETRLEAAIQNSLSCVVTAAGTAKFHSLEQFCGKVSKGNDALLNLTVTLKDLMHDVDSVEEFPSLDVGEARQLQQQWHKYKIQKLKTFSKGLELLNNQYKLFMKSVET